MTGMKCIICENEAIKLKRNITSSKGKIFDVYRCSSCKFMFVEPIPELSEVIENDTFGENYFNKFYFDDRDYFASEILELEMAVVEAQDKFVSGLLEGRKYLDIGCGDGKLLYLMKEKGWDATGVEISEIPAKYGIKNYNVDIRIGQLNENDFQKDSFDFITLRHVVEHLSNPTEVVKKAGRLLKTGGILKIDTDNSESLLNMFIFHGLIGRNNKDSIGKLYPPQHLFYFGKKSITFLLKNAGFRIIKMICPSQGTPEHFPKPDKYKGNIKDKIKQLIDDAGGTIGKGEVLVAYAKKINTV